MNENHYFKPDRSSYVLEKQLGEGLNSKVYLAVRSDPHGQSRHRVALKFLKDPSSISFLRREFETLMRVRSNYCARVIAWETLDAQPALALEWIDGISLLKLARGINARKALTPQIRNEIVRQIYLGLVDLKEAGLFHGDLQPSNVMIDRRGRVRLIDFASGRTADGFLQATPAFAAPEVFRSGVLSFEADLFALGKLKQYLPSGFCDLKAASLQKDPLLTDDPLKRGLRVPKENLPAQQRLAQMVESLLRSENDLSTQIIEPPLNDSKKTGARFSYFPNGLLQSVGALILMLMMALTLPVRAEAPSESARGFAQVSFRSEHWMNVQINGRELGYVPQNIDRLSAGTHRISWKGALGAGEMILNVKAGDRLELTETHAHAGRFKVR